MVLLWLQIWSGKLPPPAIFRRRSGSMILIYAMLTGILVSGIGYAVAKINSSAFQSKVANNIALQAQYLASSKGQLYSAMPYSGLMEQRRSAVAGTGFEDEVLVGEQENYSSTMLKRDIRVNVYKEGDEVPRSTLTFSRYDKLDEPSGCQIVTGTNNVSFAANGAYKSVTVVASSKFSPSDGTWTGSASFNISVDGSVVGTVSTTTTTQKGGSKGHYWGTTEGVTNQKTVAVNVEKGDRISVSLETKRQHKETTLTVILGT